MSLMGRNRGCQQCCGVCLVFEDDFNRADSTDPGANWYEYTPTWSIDAKRIKTSGTIGAVIATTTRGGEPYMKVQAYIDLDTRIIGEKYRILCNLVDGTYYLYAEIEFVDATHANISLCDSIAGVLKSAANVYLGEAENQAPEWYVCLSATDFVLSGDASIHICNPPVRADGRYAGLGSGSTGTVIFGQTGVGTDFQFANYHGPNGTKCCGQTCHCVDGGLRVCLADELLLTLIATGDCIGKSVDGWTAPLNRVSDTGSVWKAFGSGPMVVPTGVDWWFECQQPTPAFRLTIMEMGTGNPHDEPCLRLYDVTEIAYSCLPLVITFPIKYEPGAPFIVDYACPPCCEGFTLDPACSGSWQAIVTNPAE